MQRASNIASWRFYLLFTQIFTCFCLALSSQANFSQQASADQIWKVLGIIPRLMTVLESLKLFSLCVAAPSPSPYLQIKSRKGRGVCTQAENIVRTLGFHLQAGTRLEVLAIGLGFELQDLCSGKPAS